MNRNPPPEPDIANQWLKARTYQSQLNREVEPVVTIENIINASDLRKYDLCITQPSCTIKDWH